MVGFWVIISTNCLNDEWLDKQLNNRFNGSDLAAGMCCLATTPDGHIDMMSARSAPVAINHVVQTTPSAIAQGRLNRH